MFGGFIFKIFNILAKFLISIFVTLSCKTVYFIYRNDISIKHTALLKKMQLYAECEKVVKNSSPQGVVVTW